MIIDRADALNDWIRTKVEALCDAEPTAFAKYVQALLKKDNDEKRLKANCSEQLNVFLGNNTSEFVNSLFDVLADKSYITDSQESVKEQLKKELKEEEKPVEHRENRPVRRKISPPREDDREKEKSDRERKRRSRSPDSRRHERSRGERRRRSRSRSRSPAHRREHREDRHRRERTSNTAPLQRTNRRRCRDFEEQGLCRRGDNCMFDHGPDPIVLDDGSIEPYQPEYRSSLGSTQPDSNSQGQEYNPEQPQLNSSKVYMPPGTDFSVPPPNLQLPGQLGAPIPPPYDQMMNQRYMFMRNQMTGGPVRRDGGFNQSARGKRRFNPYSQERVPPNKSSSLEVRKIPVEANNLGAINSHFSQFGTITNIQINWNGEPDCALVTFAQLAEAQAAFKSQKAIMDNRFIQVSWHKPAPPAPEKPEGEVEPVIPFKPEHIHRPAWQSHHVPQAQAAQAAREKAQEAILQRRRDRELQSKLQELFRLKTALYDKLIFELKNVYKNVVASTDATKKSDLIKLAQSLEKQSKEIKTEIEDAHSKLQELQEKLKKPQKPTDASADQKPATETTDEPGDAKELDEAAVQRLLDESDEDAADDHEQRVRVPDEIDEDELLAADS